MKISSKNFKLVGLAVGGAVVGVTCASPAYAFDFKASGQVDRAITAADNGDNSDIGFVDNTGSNSRFRFVGDQDLNNGSNFGFVYEIGLGTNASTSFDINSTDTNANFFDNRKALVYIKGAYGKFTLGKQDGAANSTSQVDYSGTLYLGGGDDFTAYSSGLTFLDHDGNSVATIGKSLSQFDALSRQNAVRYDSPKIGGAVLSASLDAGHAYELAARYETKLAGDTKFGFAADWVDNQNQGSDIQPNGRVVTRGRRFQETGGSTSVLFANGISLSGSYKQRNFVSDAYATARNYFGGIGYAIGRNHFQVNYDRTNDYLNKGSKGQQYGVAYIFDWMPTVQLYGSYHLYQLDHAKLNGSSVNAQDINQIYTGVCLKFL